MSGVKEDNVNEEGDEEKDEDEKEKVEEEEERRRKTGVPSVYHDALLEVSVID